MKAIRSRAFKYSGREWIARLWPNSEGNPREFWNITPADQYAPIPSAEEKRRAFEAFTAWLSKQPENVA